MAGTDSSRPPAECGGPAVILVEPQLAENIGTAARAMLNCGLTDLRLVGPRQGWPHPRAVAASAGADAVIERVRVFDSLEEAIFDLERVYATTARARDMVKPVVTARAAGPCLRADAAAGLSAGVLFGRERTGLTNDEIVFAQTLINVPLNPAYSSLNLAQAVLLIAYEHRMAADVTPDHVLPLGGSRPANGKEMVGFFEHLDRILDAAEFYRTAEMRPTMQRNLRNLFQRAAPTEQEIRTLHGMIDRIARKREAGGG